MDGWPSLPSDLPLDAENLARSADADCVDLPGDSFFIGNAHYHFGHFLLEGLSRLWARDLVDGRGRKASLRYVVYEPSLEAFARELFALADLPSDRIICAPQVLRCERLFVPDMAIQTHTWLSPLQHRAWSPIRENLAGRLRNRWRSHPRKLYLSRAGTPGRRLRNEAEVEDLHRSFGFEILRPEQLSIEDQVTAVLHARTVSGCVGSQLYLTAFQRPGGRNLVIAPENFFLKDDALIANVVGHELEVIFGSRLDFAGGSDWVCDPELIRGRLKCL